MSYIFFTFEVLGRSFYIAMQPMIGWVGGLVCRGMHSLFGYYKGSDLVNSTNIKRIPAKY